MQWIDVLKKKLCISCTGCLTVSMLFFYVQNAAAEQTDEWQFEVTLYGWYTDLDGTVEVPGGPGGGGDISVDASDIIDNLEFVLMGGMEARRNRWSIIADGIYMDAGADKSTTAIVGPGVPITASASLDLTTWIISAGVGYDIVQVDRGTLAVFGGARYLSADIDTGITLPARTVASSQSAELWDGIIGLRGAINLGEHWYIPYHGDIGTGDSDLTWQLFTGIGYRFSWGNIRLGYRYLKYEQDEDKALQDLELSGPVVGVGFRF
ncbi:hypothetical protein [Desulfocastanea catecholica]